MSDCLHPEWIQDGDDQAQLSRLLHESHPLVTLLRQFVIGEIMECLDRHHQSPADLQTISLGKISGFGGDYAKGFCVHGSACFPPNIRAAGDLDMTVDMGVGYDYEQQRRAFDATLYAAVSGLPGMEFIKANMEFQSKALRQMQDERAVAAGYVRAHFTALDIERIKTKLKQRFDFSDADLAALDQLNAQTIASIIGERAKKAEGGGAVYEPTPEERAGTGLSIVTSVGLFAKDRLNIFSPYAMGDHSKSTFRERDQKPIGRLTFTHPLEAAADKFFAVLTKARAIVDEPHAKDLLDLYLHSGGEVKKSRCRAPFRHNNRSAIVDMIRASWPAHPGFFNDELYFSRTDPGLPKTIKEVKDGLLKLKQHGVITPQTFGGEITPDNAENYAQILLDHAWGLCVECMGVERSGTHKNPSYVLHPLPAVKDYWDACRAIPDMARASDDESKKNERAAATEENLRQKIDPVLEGEYEAADRINIAATAAINALTNGDKSRMWVGYKGVR